jgi:non-ribosomal peptide synthetase component F
MQKVSKELLAHEGDRTRDREAVEEPLQYAELAAWQNEWLESEEARPGRDYWRSLDLTPARQLCLPGDGALARQSGQFEWVQRKLEPGLTREIRRRPVCGDLSIADFLLTCWMVLLHRLTRQPELVLGCMANGRQHEEFLEVIGPLSRSLPLAVSVSGSTPFADFARKVRVQRETGVEWQESFNWELLRQAEDDTGAPPWRYGFEHSRLRDFPAGCRSGEAKICELTSYDERFDCSLSCTERDGSFSLSFCYDRSKFARSEVEQLADRFESLLRHAVDQPDSPVGDLPVLTASERQRLLMDFNDTAAEFPRDLCAHQLIERHAENRPDDVAVVHGEQQITYAQHPGRNLPGTLYRPGGGHFGNAQGGGSLCTGRSGLPA